MAQRTVSDEQRRFLAILSHELRTPLAGLIGLIELAVADPARRDDDLRAAASAARHVLELVDEVLDLAAIESGQLRLRDEVVDVGEVVREALTTVEATARDKGLTLIAEVAPIGKRRGDALRLRQVLVNLLGNAVRHTEHGGVVVRVYAGEGDEVVLAVVDSGSGVDPGEAEALFEPFAQGDGPRGAAGLGLAISRELVGRMGGRMWIETGEERGSVFAAAVRMRAAVVRAPAAAGADAGIDADVDADDPEAAPVLTILVIDDQAFTRDILLRQVAALGHRGLAADTIDTAAAAIGTARVDLALLDLHLGGARGVDGAPRLRAAAGPRWLPIVLVSADVTGEAEVDAAGLDGWLLRPVDSRVLASLAAQLDDGRLSAPIDRDELLDRLGGRPALVREVARLFMDRHGEISGPLRAALAVDDPDVMARAAHAARGAVGMVCANHAVEICAAIEAGADDPAACAGLVEQLERELRRAAASIVFD